MEKKDDNLANMPRWQQMQYKSFRAWVNHNLGTEVEQLSTAFADGILLARLLSNLSGETIRGIKPDPTFRIQKINNLAACFAFVRAIPILLQNIMPEDVADGNIKLILGLSWVLILHYQIQGGKVEEEPQGEEDDDSSSDEEEDAGDAVERAAPTPAVDVTPEPSTPSQPTEPSPPTPSEIEVKKGSSIGSAISEKKGSAIGGKGSGRGSGRAARPQMRGGSVRAARTDDPKSALLKAVNDYCKDTPEQFASPVTNFTTDWQDAFKFLNLIYCNDPSLVDLAVRKDKLAHENAELAFNILKEKYNVPKLLDAEDLVSTRPDEKSVMTYVSLVLEHFEKQDRRKKHHKKRKTGKKTKKTPRSKTPREQPVSPRPSGGQVPLTVRVAGATDVQGADGEKPDPYVTLTVPGKQLKKEYKTTVIQKCANPEWNEEFNLEGENITDEDKIQFSLYNNKANKEPLATTQIPVKQLRDGVQNVWMPLSAKDESASELHFVTAPNGKAKLPIVTGEPLDLRICSGRNLSNEGLCDPYVVLEVKGAKRRPRRTKTKKATIHPVWNEKYHFLRDELKDGDVVRLSVYDWKRVGKDDRVGIVEIPVSDFIASPEYDEWLPISKGNGELHIQGAWGKAVLPPKPKGKPLVVRVAKARHLKAADRSGFSDPYCVVSVVGNKVDKSLKTEIIKATLNPEWNDEFVFGGNAGPEDTLHFEIFDRDVLALRDRSLGWAELPLTEHEHTPNVDRWLLLSDPNIKKKGQGELHVQLAYGEEAQLPPVPEGESLIVRIAAARDLETSDKSGYSDPYVVVKLHNKKISKKMKTHVVKQTLNPEWNEEFSFERGEVAIDADTARLTVFDHDRILHDTPLGLVDIPLKTLQQKPLLDDWFPLTKADGSGERVSGEVHLVFAHGSETKLPPLGAPFSARLVGAQGVKGLKGGVSDPYAKVEVVSPVTKSRKPFKTKAIENTVNPVWCDEFEWNRGEVNPVTDSLKVTVCDWNHETRDKPLGQAIIPLSTLGERPVQEISVPIMDPADPSKRGQGELKVVLAFDADLPPATTGKPVNVRIVGASGLRGSDSYCLLKVKGKKTGKMKTGVQHKTITPEWNKEFFFKGGELDPTKDTLFFSVRNKGELKDDKIGAAQLSLLPLVEKPTIDTFLNLDSGGDIHVQVSYGDVPLPRLSEHMLIRVIGARDLRAADRGGYSDPYVVINRVNRPLKKRLRTEKKKNTVHPIWNSLFEWEEGIINPGTDVMSFTLFDWDRVGKDEQLGVVHLPVKDIGINTLYDAWIPLRDPKQLDKRAPGELHIQAVYGDAMLLYSTAGKGIRFRVAEAKSLAAADKSSTSNPYCIVKVQGKKLKKMRTKVVKKTVSPIWNEEFSIPKEKLVISQDKMQVTVYDWDRFGRKTALGFAEFPLNVLADKPVVDIWVPLKKDAKRSDLSGGQVHICAALEGHKLPPASREFVIAVVEGHGLPTTDKSGTCDAYCQVNVLGKKSRTKLKTKVVKKDVNPVWNQQFIFDTKFLEPNDVFRFSIFDWDRLSKNDLLGQVEISAVDLFQEDYLDTWRPIIITTPQGDKQAGELHIIFAIGDGILELAKLFDKQSNIPSKILPPHTNLSKRKEGAADDDDDDSSSSSDSDSEDEKIIPKGAKAVLKIRAEGARDLESGNESEESHTSPFVVVTVPGKKLKKEYKTKPVEKDQNPEWNEEFDFSGEDILDSDTLRFTFVDSETKKEMGTSEIPVKRLLKSQDEFWLPVRDHHAKGEDRGEGEFHISTANGPRAKLAPIKGEPLDLRICGARDLGRDHSSLTDPYVVIKIKGRKRRRNRRTRMKKATLHPVWNRKFYFLRGEVNEEDVLEFNVFDWKRVGKDEQIGIVEIPIKDFIASPEYDEWLPVGVGRGHLHIQGAWGKARLPPKPKGQPLLVRIAKARHLKAADRSGFSDPYCRLSVAGQKVKRSRATRVIKSNLNPEWNETFLFEGDVGPEDVLRFEVFDSDRFSVKKKSLGLADLALSDLADNPNVDKWLSLVDSGSKRKAAGQGEVHVQLAYGEDAQLPPLAEGSVLAFRIAAARDLPAVDKSGYSDPYVVVKLHTKKVKRKLKTKVARRTVDPEWNEDFSFERGEVDVDVDTLRFIIFDYDRLLRDDPLGVVDLPLAALRVNPVYDEWLPISGGHGALHVLLVWGDDASLPPPGQTTLVRIAEGYNIPAYKGNPSNPFVVVTLNSANPAPRKNPLKTKVIKQNANPAWYDEFSFNKGEVNPETDSLTLTAFTADKASKKDVELGKVVVPLQPLELNPILDGLYSLEGSKGEVRITIAYGQDLPGVAAGKPIAVRVVEAKDLKSTPNAYVELKIEGKKASKGLKTPVQRRTATPGWNSEFKFNAGELNASRDTLRFVVKNEGEIKDEDIGAVDVNLLQLITNPLQDLWLPIKSRGKKADEVGQLHLQIVYGDTQLPKVGERFSLRIVAARNLHSGDRSGYADPYVVVSRVNRPFKRRHRTEIKKKTIHPVWNSEFEWDEGVVKASDDVILFDVFNWERTGKDESLGSIELPVRAVGVNSVYDQWLPLKASKSHGKKGADESGQGELHIQAVYGNAALPEISSGHDVKLRVTEARDLIAHKSGTSDPYCVVKIQGKKLKKMKTKVVKKTVAPQWNDVFQLPADKLVVAQDVALISVYDWDRVGRKTSLGYAQLPLNSLADSPVIDVWVPLFRDKKCTDKSSGEVHIAVALEGHSLPPSIETLSLALVEGKGLIAADKSGTSSPYCILTVPGKKARHSLKTPTAKKTLNPVWNQTFVFNAKYLELDHDEIHVTVHESKSVTLGSLVIKPGEYTNQGFMDTWLPLTAPKEHSGKDAGKIRVLLASGAEEVRIDEFFAKERSVPNKMTPPATNLTVSKEERPKKIKEKKPKEKKKLTESQKAAPRSSNDPPVYTKIKVRIAEARHLKAADRGGTSDPYVTLEVPGRRLKKRVYTKTIKRTLNPLWNEDFDLSKENIDPDKDILQFVVYTWMRVGDNLPISKVQIPLSELIAKPIFDAWLPLGEFNNPGKKTQGELHIITAYDTMDLPDVAETRKEKGVPVNVRVAEARDLPEDIDPYVAIEVPRKKKEKRIKTSVSKKREWNEDFNLTNEGVLPDDIIRFNVYDHRDSILGKDSHVGFAEVPVSDLVKTPLTDKWFKLKHLDENKEADGELRLILAYGKEELPSKKKDKKEKKGRKK